MFLAWISHARFILLKNQIHHLTLILLFFMRSKLISSPRSNLVSFLKASISPFCSLPNLQLPVSQTYAATIPWSILPLTSQFHGMNASDCHFWTLLITAEDTDRVEQQDIYFLNSIFIYSPSVFVSWDFGSYNLSVSCDGENDCIDGRGKAPFTWMISKYKHIFLKEQNYQEKNQHYTKCFACLCCTENETIETI